MKLITVEAQFERGKTDAALAAVQEQSQVVTAIDGCEGYALYRAGDRLAIVQKWRSAECFDAYLRSGAFAALGRTLTPLMSAPPVTTIASVDTL